jgi:hypothetical protein
VESPSLLSPLLSLRYLRGREEIKIDADTEPGADINGERERD